MMVPSLHQGVTGLADLALKASTDRKTQARKAQKNTFGLLPASGGEFGTCPDATHGKGGCAHIKKNGKRMTCYVDPLMRAYPNIRAVLAHNTFLVRNANYEQLVMLLRKEFNRFYKLEMKKTNPWPYYRLHWSGDFFSETYVEATAKAISLHPEIHFWAYTRSFRTIPNIVDHFEPLKNLQLYLSLDPQNSEDGLKLWYRHQKNHPDTRLQVAWMGTKEGYENQPWEKPKTSTCPELTGHLPLQSACFHCQKCLGSRRSPVSILFTA